MDHTGGLLTRSAGLGDMSLYKSENMLFSGRGEGRNIIPYKPSSPRRQIASLALLAVDRLGSLGSD